MHKVKVLLLLLTWLYSVTTRAQKKEDTADTLAYRSVLVITFDPKLYMSDIDREILEGSGLSFNELVKLYRDQVGTHAARKLAGKFKVNYLLSKAVSDTIDDYAYTYSAVRYSYEPLPDLRQKSKSLLSKKGDNKSPERGQFSEGQLKESPGSKVPRHMVVTIKNRNLLEYLRKKYNPDYLLFITQFETRTDVSDPAALGAEQNKRLIKAHFTVLDSKGDKVYSNIAEEVFKAGQNNIKEVIEQKFPSLGEQIAACLTEGITFKIKKDK